VFDEELEGKFDTTVTYYRGQAAYALDALKDANQKFLKRLETSLSEPQG